jgi:ATP-dependent RNA helicase DHX37/DHR1
MFQRLQDMQAELPSGLLPSLASASTLGSRQLQSHADKAAKLEDKTVRRALKRRRGAADEGSGSDEGDSEEDWEAGKGGPIKPRPTPVAAEQEGAEAKQGVAAGKPSWSGATVVDAKAPVVVGGALAKDADGNPLAPVVVKRKTKGPMVRLARPFELTRSAGS